MTAYNFPDSKTSANYVLLRGDSYYKSRQGSVLGIVLHVTAGLQDLDLKGTDLSAEGTAKWAVGRPVSWHAGVDSDSIVPCLPSSYTGWHAKGYNSRTIGIEISNKDARWDNKPAAWVTKTLRNAARAAAGYVKDYNLPLTRATKSQVDAAHRSSTKFGFTYHSYLSDIRVDPGKTFPWDRFIAMVKEELKPPAPKPPAPRPPAPKPPAPKPTTRRNVDMFIVQVDGKPAQYVYNGTNLYWIKNKVVKANLEAAWKSAGLDTTIHKVKSLDGLGVLVGENPYK